MHSFKWILKVEVKHVTASCTRSHYTRQKCNSRLNSRLLLRGVTANAFFFFFLVGAHAADNYTCSDWRLFFFFFFPQEVQTPVSLHQVVCFLGTCVSRAGRRKDSGQQGQTRQPLRSHQVCRDTLEHSEPDGICPPGVRSRPDDIQAQGQAKKEGRMEDGTSCL